jgi:hypothetical protein
LSRRRRFRRGSAPKKRGESFSHGDPTEIRNLVLEPEKNRETILRMNALLNDLIAKEVGENACGLLERALGPIGQK